MFVYVIMCVCKVRLFLCIGLYVLSTCVRACPRVSVRDGLDTRRWSRQSDESIFSLRRHRLAYFIMQMCVCVYIYNGLSHGLALTPFCIMDRVGRPRNVELLFHF